MVRDQTWVVKFGRRWLWQGIDLIYHRKAMTDEYILIEWNL